MSPRPLLVVRVENPGPEPFPDAGPDGVPGGAPGISDGGAAACFRAMFPVRNGIPPTRVMLPSLATRM